MAKPNNQFDPPRGNTPVCVSLFSGGMGLDLGLEAAGFSIRFAADNFAPAVETIKKNRPQLPCFQGDIRELTGETIREIGSLSQEIDLVAGGPPCQPFSTAGKRLGLDDAGKGPYIFEFVRLVSELRPRAFLLENVKGILSASTRWRQLPYNNNGIKIDEWHGSLLRELLERFRKIGYAVKYQEFDAADYGVPQRRHRVFFMGLRDGGTSIEFPRPTHSRQAGLLLRPWLTLGHALHGLEKDDSHCAKFSPRKLRYLREIPPGGNWRFLSEDLQRESMGRAFFAKGGRSGYWRRLAMEQPCLTILTEPQNASTSLCHPLEDRPLTVRECARVQTFPDDWIFCGRGAEQYRLVGNAVPVLLAQRLGESVRETLAVDSTEKLCVV